VQLEVSLAMVAMGIFVAIVFIFALAGVLSWIVGFGFVRRRTLWESAMLLVTTALPFWDIDNFKKKHNIKVPGEERWPREVVQDD
jgi:hypothetical protein